MTDDTITDRCQRCGKTIELRPVSTRNLTYRWYSNTRQSGWHCGDDPMQPTLAHAPNRVVLPAEQKHDFESPRGDSLPVGACAVCGLYQEARLHA